MPVSPAPSHHPELIVWGSGGGSTFEALATDVGEGRVPKIEIPAVLTDKPNAGITNVVECMNARYGFDTQVVDINRELFPGGARGRIQTQAEAEATLQFMQDHPRATLALLGCMRILGPEVVDALGWHPEWEDACEAAGKHRARAINTHPGILPATAGLYGMGPSKHVLVHGYPETAQTLVALAPEVDGGPVIAEHTIEVPVWNIATPERLENAAHMLFRTVQAVEKLHIGSDVAAFLLKRQEFGYAA